MKRIQFDSKGRLASVDNKILDFNFKEVEEALEDDDDSVYEKGHLKTSNELEFLRDELKEEWSKGDKPREITFNDETNWSLYSNGERLNPLKFSNGKTQEDVVKEVVDLIKHGKKVIFIHGVCGTGKSAIALNIARCLGKASIVVPVKGLQRQYEEDYMGKKYLLKQSGKKMKIAMISGRENHDSIIKPGISCGDPFLPDTIKITEKNREQLKEFYMENPYIKNKVEHLNLSALKRISIAPANPYWSPIVPSEYELPIKDAKKKKYMGLRGREFTFYHRKEGCSYYDQYLAYINADVIIYNSAKYKIEVALDRKPETEVDIIDEADEFLDNFSTQDELNLTRLGSSFKNIFPEDLEAREIIDQIQELIKLEERNKDAIGIDEDKVEPVKDTKVEKILRLLLKNKELESEISMDDANYANKALEIAKDFKGFFDDTYVTFRRREKDLYAGIVTTNLSKKFIDIVEKSKALVFMSGTLHSPVVLKEIFGITDYKIVEAETSLPGVIEIQRTGKEFDCRYSNFASKRYSKKDYLNALSYTLEKAKKPMLVHVNAFEDLPSYDELRELNISNITAKEKLKELQIEDKTGRMISLFKSKLTDNLFTTKCARGVDFPGDICNSIVFTKYPNPNVNGVFWKILQKTHPNYFWDFYRDKARREFLQRIYRAVRSKDDHVYILSPDVRVLDAVRDIQLGNGKK